MANFVIKKDGTKQPFDAGKIKRVVSAAAIQAGLSNEEAVRVADQVSSAVTQSVAGKEEVASTEIRGKILSELDTVNPSVSEAWRKYEQSK